MARQRANRPSGADEEDYCVSERSGARKALLGKRLARARMNLRSGKKGRSSYEPTATINPAWSALAAGAIVADGSSEFSRTEGRTNDQSCYNSSLSIRRDN